MSGPAMNTASSTPVKETAPRNEGSGHSSRDNYVPPVGHLIYMCQDIQSKFSIDDRGYDDMVRGYSARDLWLLICRIRGEDNEQGQQLTLETARNASAMVVSDSKKRGTLIHGSDGKKILRSSSPLQILQRCRWSQDSRKLELNDDDSDMLSKLSLIHSLSLVDEFVDMFQLEANTERLLKFTLPQNQLLPSLLRLNLQRPQSMRSADAILISAGKAFFLRRTMEEKLYPGSAAADVQERYLKSTRGPPLNISRDAGGKGMSRGKGKGKGFEDDVPAWQAPPPAIAPVPPVAPGPPELVMVPKSATRIDEQLSLIDVAAEIQEWMRRHGVSKSREVPFISTLCAGAALEVFMKKRFAPPAEIDAVIQEAGRAGEVGSGPSISDTEDEITRFCEHLKLDQPTRDFMRRKLSLRICFEIAAGRVDSCHPTVLKSTCGSGLISPWVFSRLFPFGLLGGEEVPSVPAIVEENRREGRGRVQPIKAATHDYTAERGAPLATPIPSQDRSWKQGGGGGHSYDNGMVRAPSAGPVGSRGGYGQGDSSRAQPYDDGHRSRPGNESFGQGSGRRYSDENVRGRHGKGQSGGRGGFESSQGGAYRRGPQHGQRKKF